MTAPTAVHPLPAEIPQSSVVCFACGHPADAHDATAARYCAATQARALDRGCVCGSA